MSLKIKLEFYNPSFVGLFAEPDRVQIQFAGNFYFFDQNGQTIPALKTLTGAIPPIKTGFTSSVSAETTAIL
jgi:hypothetical protein